jgi:hypothetical protein
MIDRALQVLQIGRSAIVHDHEIDRQPLQPPIFEGAQQLPHNIKVLGAVDPEQNDRQVAGNAMRPQRRDVSAAALERLGRRTKRGIGKDDPCSEPLKQMRFLRPDAEVVELSLRLCPGHRGKPVEGGRLAMPIGEGRGLLRG